MIEKHFISLRKDELERELREIEEKEKEEELRQ